MTPGEFFSQDVRAAGQSSACLHSWPPRTCYVIHCSGRRPCRPRGHRLRNIRLFKWDIPPQHFEDPKTHTQTHDIFGLGFDLLNVNVRNGPIPVIYSLLIQQTAHCTRAHISWASAGGVHQSRNYSTVCGPSGSPLARSSQAKYGWCVYATLPVCTRGTPHTARELARHGGWSSP